MSATPKGRQPKHLPDVRPEYLLLGFLQREKLHGYDLLRQYQAHLGHVWKLSQSQLYSILKRLEARRLITAVDDDSEESSTRRTFAATALGKEHFEEWLATPTDTNSRILRLEFISRLYFTRRLGSSDALAAIVENQKAAVAASLARHEALLAAASPDEPCDLLSLEFRVRQLRSIASWLAECVEPRMGLHT